MTNVSLFASSIRSKLYDDLIKSLQGTSVSYEIVFAGPSNCDDMQAVKNIQKKFDNSNSFDGLQECQGLINGDNIFKYIQTKNIKPAQCYEIARRACSGEVVIWIADDCEFPNDVIGKAYKYWKSKNNEKLILSIQTKESGYRTPKSLLFNMDLHRFFGFDRHSPLMAPLGLMSRKYLDDLGGIDARYVCGQYENDIVMRAYYDGGTVEIFGGEDCFIDIDHLSKSINTGESRNENDFLNRPFAKGYHHDRAILEYSWSVNRHILSQRSDIFIPFSDLYIKTESQGAKGIWE